MTFQDHTDDAGYRAMIASADTDVLLAFIEWLAANDIGHTFQTDDSEIVVWTEWITDGSKAMLLKLTWGGR